MQWDLFQNIQLGTSSHTDGSEASIGSFVISTLNERFPSQPIDDLNTETPKNRDVLTTDTESQSPLNNSNNSIVFDNYLDVSSYIGGVPIETLFVTENKTTQPSEVSNENRATELYIQATEEAQISSRVSKVRPRSSFNAEDESVTKKTKYRNTLNVNLNEILAEHPLGASILTIYKHTQQLDTQCQSYVCDIIVLYFLKINTS